MFKRIKRTEKRKREKRRRGRRGEKRRRSRQNGEKVLRDQPVQIRGFFARREVSHYRSRRRSLDSEIFHADGLYRQPTVRLLPRLKLTSLAAEEHDENEMSGFVNTGRREYFMAEQPGIGLSAVRGERWRRQSSEVFVSGKLGWFRYWWNSGGLFKLVIYAETII